MGVVTDSGLDRTLDYVAPLGGVALGALVLVPLGPRRVLGCVWGEGVGTIDAARLKPVAAILPVPPLRPGMRAFLERASNYTLTPLTSMLRLATRAPGLDTGPPERRLLRISARAQAAAAEAPPGSALPGGALPNGALPPAKPPADTAATGVQPAAASTGLAPAGPAHTNAAPTGAAPTGAAPTGAAPTGAAPTGAAPTGAAQTGAASPGDASTGATAIGSAARADAGAAAAGAMARGARAARAETSSVGLPRMTPARARVLAVLEARGNLGETAAELAREAGVGTSVLTGLVRQGVLEVVAVPRDPAPARLDPAFAPPALSPDQQAAAAALRAEVSSRRYTATLLKGVTGSGKTETYLEAVAACLAAGRQALVMLPEIALSVDFLARVERRFGARPPEWHSALTPAQRRRTWEAAASGEARLVVGVRSAVFLPFAELGLIVVDEEHDGSYKQEDGALYHARDMAVLRASLEGAAVVLASATPSLESWANAAAGKYRRLDLPERYGEAVLPRMRALDLRADPAPAGQWIAPALAVEVGARLGAGEQSLLFLNRRGYAPVTVCRACGHQIGCPDCDARLVEHRFRSRLVCHQCGHEEPVPAACPACKAEGRLAALGPGVERLAEEAAGRWPEARIAILSSDLAEGPKELKARIDLIASGGADIIIGTQIVSKGHNFPLLTLVGVIDADLGLQGGDLRAAEKTFQLIRQVAGRAGRADRPGLALIQTHAPEHPVLRAILTGDDEGFWRAEALARRAAGAPPYGRLAGIILSGTDETRTWETAMALAREAAPLDRAGALLFGPAPAPIARVRGRHRVRLLLKAARGAPLQAAIRAWLAATPIPSGVRAAVDIDPQSFL